MTTPAETQDVSAATVIHGDAAETLRGMPDNSVDAIVTDPPYEYGFTGAVELGWDSTGVAFSADLWREALRVLKPGGNLAAFGHAKTYHRLAVAIEDAGFELRDTIMAWLYGQGMAKGTDVSKDVARTRPDIAGDALGWHSNLRPAYEPIVIARKPLDGSLPDSWITHRVGGLNIDATRVPTTESRSRTPGDGEAVTWRIQRGRDKNESHDGGRWTPNVVLCHTPDCDDQCTPDCVVAEVKKQGLATRGRGEDATRFFPVFRYQPKAPNNERPVVDGVKHATVKPLGLMRWLIELTTPPGGTVLDPFAGSGTTAEAAIELGFPSISIEKFDTYLPLIHHRIDRATQRITGGHP